MPIKSKKNVKKTGSNEDNFTGDYHFWARKSAPRKRTSNQFGLITDISGLIVTCRYSETTKNCPRSFINKKNLPNISSFTYFTSQTNLEIIKTSHLFSTFSSNQVVIFSTTTPKQLLLKAPKTFEYSTLRFFRR